MPDRADERAWLNAALEHANARVATLEGELEQEKQRISRLRAELEDLDEEVRVDASPVRTADLAVAPEARFENAHFGGRVSVIGLQIEDSLEVA